MIHVVALPLTSGASVSTSAFARRNSDARTRCVRRSHPVASSSSSSSWRVCSASAPTTPDFAGLTASRRRANIVTIRSGGNSAAAAAGGGIVGPAFEIAARVKAPFQSPFASEALAALLLATAIAALLGRDDNNLLLATVTFRAMSIASIARWWLSPTGHVVAFSVLAIKTFLGMGIPAVRQPRRDGRDLWGAWGRKDRRWVGILLVDRAILHHLVYCGIF